MAVVIRMQKVGKLNAPSFRIGVFDRKTRREGKAVEIIGFYDPRNKNEEKQLVLKKDRALYWLQQGAQPSETMASIFKRQGVVYQSGSQREKQKREATKKHRHERTAKAKASAKTAKAAKK